MAAVLPAVLTDLTNKEDKHKISRLCSEFSFKQAALLKAEDMAVKDTLRT